jgi:hypothetical protein
MPLAVAHGAAHGPPTSETGSPRVPARQKSTHRGREQDGASMQALSSPILLLPGDTAPAPRFGTPSPIVPSPASARRSSAQPHIIRKASHEPAKPKPREATSAGGEASALDRRRYPFSLRKTCSRQTESPRAVVKSVLRVKQSGHRSWPTAPPDAQTPSARSEVGAAKPKAWRRPCILDENMGQRSSASSQQRPLLRQLRQWARMHSPARSIPRQDLG